MLPPSLRQTPSKDQPELVLNDMEYTQTDTEPTLCRLTSIKDLRAEVRDNMHNELTNLFATHTFVGIVDEQRRVAAIQGGVKLYLVDYGMLSNEYFYQVGLTDFGNFGRIKFDPPLRLHDVLLLAASQEKTLSNDTEDLDWDEVVSAVEAQLLSRREMLAEYFSLEITASGDLCSLPLLLRGYTPSLAKLPRFLLRLGPHVDWQSEKGCFHTFLQELASFHVPESLPVPVANEADKEMELLEDEAEIRARREQLNRAVEHVVFPALRARLVATRGLLRGVTEVADLKGLYRVFERC